MSYRNRISPFMTGERAPTSPTSDATLILSPVQASPRASLLPWGGTCARASTLSTVLVRATSKALLSRIRVGTATRAPTSLRSEPLKLTCPPFSINSLFSVLCEDVDSLCQRVGARGYLSRGKDPVVAGWAWSFVGHDTPTVGWEGLNERFVCDPKVGGGACPWPCVLPCLRRRIRCSSWVASARSCGMARPPRPCRRVNPSSPNQTHFDQTPTPS